MIATNRGRNVQAIIFAAAGIPIGMFASTSANNNGEVCFVVLRAQLQKLNSYVGLNWKPPRGS